MELEGEVKECKQRHLDDKKQLQGRIVFLEGFIQQLKVEDASHEAKIEMLSKEKAALTLEITQDMHDQTPH